ncbi:Hypothetical predicted protein [Octopus vulgaris]|uniref:Uncharacterized protein n=1 Tax=Octopus vulgaris TaxID=6645 RepID=A0AA36EZR4_OCTVU|nr:Hypothetical predicted protein [Octopus vulgaris]
MKFNSTVSPQGYIMALYTMHKPIQEPPDDIMQDINWRHWLDIKATDDGNKPKERAPNGVKLASLGPTAKANAAILAV